MNKRFLHAGSFQDVARVICLALAAVPVMALPLSAVPALNMASLADSPEVSALIFLGFYLVLPLLGVAGLAKLDEHKN
jgi:hypothetical protein